MATSSNVFIVFVVFAVAMLIAVFAWVAGNKRSQKPTSVRPQTGVCPSGTTSTATRRRPPLSSSTTQWDHAIQLVISSIFTDWRIDATDGRH